MITSPSPRLSLAIAGALFATLPSAFAAAPKVEETAAGTVGQVGHYVISERGAHLGWAGAKGAKFTAIVDGVEGPEFDQLLRPTGENVLNTNRTMIGPATQGTTGQYNEGPLLMSVDGEHHAYMGRQGSDIVVIHDGKEIGRGPVERFFFQSNPLRITPNGKQVCWTEIDSSQAEPLYRVVVTGKPGPWAAAAGSSGVIFSADESRHAYRYTSKDKKHALAVDGKDAGYLGNNPTFTADGKLLITSGMEGKEAVIMVDGKAVARGVRAGRLFAASTGRRWGALLFRKDAQYNDVSVLIIDGKEVPDGAETANVWFSPDGKRYAAASHHHFNRGPDYMIVDGKRGTEFQNVPDREEPFWSPDSSTLIYTAKSATGPEIVVVANSKETVFSGRLIDGSVEISERGGHYAFTKSDARNQLENIIDGKPGAATAQAGTFVFSADGSRLGYLSGSPASTLVLDDQPVPDLVAGYFAITAGSAGPAKSRAFILSPDGKHVTTFARVDTIKGLGLWLDGKVVHSSQYPAFYPTFTPDSKHLIWGAEEAGATPRDPATFVVYADGLPAVIADGSFFQRRPDIWAMDASGVVSFLAADGDVVKRYRITAASNTSVATLITDGTTVAIIEAKPPPPPPVATAPAPPPAPKQPVTPAPVPLATTTPTTTAPTPAAALTWNDLVNRPEARPTACTVNREYRFQGGSTVRAGTPVNILDITQGEVVVGTMDGRVNFRVAPDETDALAVANTTWAQLTPAQRDLTYPALLNRPDLWPYRVKLVLPFELEGRSTRIGDPALLLSVEGSQLLVRLENTEIAFNVAPHETDLLTQARAVLGGQNGPPGRLLEEFSGKLVNPMNGQAVALDPNARPKYVVLYMGAGWCPPCLQFSPKLVKVLTDKAPKSADVTTIYVSGDRTPAEAKTYLTKLGVAWPTIYFKNRGQLPAFAPLFGDVIPQLVVTDRHGSVVIDSARVGYDQALSQLQQLL